MNRKRLALPQQEMQCFEKKLDVLNTKLNKIIQIQIQENQQYKMDQAHNNHLRARLTTMIHKRDNTKKCKEARPQGFNTNYRQLLNERQEQLKWIEKNQGRMEENKLIIESLIKQNQESLLSLQRKVFVLQSQNEEASYVLAQKEKESLRILQVSRQSIQKFKQKQEDKVSLHKYESLICYKIENIREQNDKDILQTSNENHMIKSTCIRRSQVKQLTETQKYTRLVKTKHLLVQQLSQKNRQLEAQRAHINVLTHTSNSSQSNNKQIQEHETVRKGLLAKQSLLKATLGRINAERLEPEGEGSRMIMAIQLEVKGKNQEIGRQDAKIKHLLEEVREKQQGVERGISEKYLRHKRTVSSGEGGGMMTTKKRRRVGSVSMSEQTVK